MLWRGRDGGICAHQIKIEEFFEWSNIWKRFWTLLIFLISENFFPRFQRFQGEVSIQSELSSISLENQMIHFTFPFLFIIYLI